MAPSSTRVSVTLHPGSKPTATEGAVGHVKPRKAAVKQETALTASSAYTVALYIGEKHTEPSETGL